MSLFIIISMTVLAEEKKKRNKTMSVLILHFLFLKLHLLIEAKKHLLHCIIVGLLSSHNGITKRFPVVSVGFIQEKLRQIFLCFFPVISYTRICISQDANVLFWDNQQPACCRISFHFVS